jgi:dipeptidyl aminopeptidase/acylaminoacyl peptidase
VLSANFRGSIGFGKAFINAGDGEWGRRMDDDLCDAVAWAVAEGHADPARIAIMGTSYGGYATLVGLTRHPELYACGVDIVGPSNLETLLRTIPPYWESIRADLYRAIGDIDTAEGLAQAHERSPLFRAANIRKPLLIAQGANDPRVKQAESDQMVAALRTGGVPVTYVLSPTKGTALRDRRMRSHAMH